MSADCWADPLSRKERKEVRLLLARAGRRLYRAAMEEEIGESDRYARLSSSMDMADLHIDVTERAEVPAS